MILSFLTVFHCFICVVLVIIVLLQHGKGADMGVALGGGGGNSLFGASGAESFITKLTTVCAVLFMATSISLALGQRKLHSASASEGTLFQDQPAASVPAAPAEASGGVVAPPQAATGGTEAPIEPAK